MATLATDSLHGRKLIWQKAFQRWLTRSSMDEILTNLFLGGSHAAEYLADYNPNGINFVLTVMDRDLSQQVRQKFEGKGIQHLYKEKRDKNDENILETFGELCAIIEDKLQGGQKVLVHCAMGISRSATVVCAYLMQRWGLNRSDAKQMVRNKRNVANPNHSFYTQLKVWEQCKYKLQSAISVDGVKPYKLEYQEWLAEFEETNRKEKMEREQRRRERELDSGSN